MTYEEAIAFWFGRINYEVRSATTKDLKLERMRALLRLLGDPQDRLRIVHVTGTKGKGSTCAMLAQMLQAAGYRVGLFTSPHLVHVEERFQVNRQAITRQEFAALMGEVAVAVHTLDTSSEWASPTFFEISTAIGFLHFVRRRVDVAVIEVGLGGRYDSTNICTPILTVITSVGYDHMAQLGQTLPEIAYQKAGIIKRNIPCVSGAIQNEAKTVVHTVANDLGVKVTQLHEQIQYQLATGTLNVTVGNHHLPYLKVNLHGAHQAANAALAVAGIIELRRLGLTIPDDALRRGLAEVVWPARIEYVHKAPIAVIIDSAHNVPSIQALIDTIQTDFAMVTGPKVAIFAVSSDKQYAEMLALLSDCFDHFELTIYTNNARSVPAEKLAQVLAGSKPSTLHVHPHAAWYSAIKRIQSGGMIVVCGSVFLAGELRDFILNELKVRL